MAEFARRVGARQEATSFRKLHDRLKTEKLSAKQVEEVVWDARGKASFTVPRLISKQPLDDAKKEQLTKEFFKLRDALSEALFQRQPAKFAETEISGLAGIEESTKVLGDTTAAGAIAKQSLDVVGRFSRAVFTGDIETAYGLCANELRVWMSVKRFCTELQKADQQYDGRAVDYVVERIACIYSDHAARQTGNDSGGWPKDTPKPNKRAVVGTYWFTKPVEKRGRWAMFWVTEEPEGYRIAKFNQYLQ